MADLIDSIQTLEEFLGDSGFELDDSTLTQVAEHADSIEVGIDTRYKLLDLSGGTVRIERGTSVVWWRVAGSAPKKLAKSLTAEVKAHGEDAFLQTLNGMLWEADPGDDGDEEGFDEFQEKYCSAVEAALKYELLRAHPELLEAALAAGQQDELIEEAGWSSWAEGVFAVACLAASHPELMQALAASPRFLRNLLSQLEEEDAGEEAMRAISQLAGQAGDLKLLEAVARNPDTPEDVRQGLLAHPDAAVRETAQEYLDDLALNG